MRVFALSDVHVDYDENARWVRALSESDYSDDALVLAGDIADSLQLLGWCLEMLTRRFRVVAYVPGNHDLWVAGGSPSGTSLQKFEDVRAIAFECGALTSMYVRNGLAIVPLLSWYDYSFGQPDPGLHSTWMDFNACVWPDGFGVEDVTNYFLARNEPLIRGAHADVVISFSHFLPRIDLMPDFVPMRHRRLYPVLGTARLEAQIRELASTIHVYGHSHLNRHVEIEGITYVNNALGYPHEAHIAARDLQCVHGGSGRDRS